MKKTVLLFTIITLSISCLIGLVIVVNNLPKITKDVNVLLQPEPTITLTPQPTFSPTIDPTAVFQADMKKWSLEASRYVMYYDESYSSVIDKLALVKEYNMYLFDNVFLDELDKSLDEMVEHSYSLYTSDCPDFEINKAFEEIYTETIRLKENFRLGFREWDAIAMDNGFQNLKNIDELVLIATKRLQKY